MNTQSLLAAALAASIAVPALARGIPGYPLVPGEAIIRTNNAKALPAVLATLSKQFSGVGVIDQIDGRPIYLISYALAEGQTYHDVKLALDGFVLNGSLAWQEMNYVGQTGEGHTDSLWLSGIGANSTGYLDQYAVPLLGVNEAFARSRGAGVVVSVIDTGIDGTHRAFNGMVSTMGASFVPGSPGFNDIRQYADTDGDGQVDEQYGHGTFVAGLIHLVAPEARILPVRALDSNGRGNNFRIAQAVAWSIDRGAHIINMSLGEVYGSLALADMVQEASLGGSIVIGAAGNRNAENPREFPACSSFAIGVSATDWADTKAPFTNYERLLDLAGPGDSEIINGVPNMARSIISIVPGNNYAIWEGTSFSTAFTSGCAALVRAQHPQWPDASTASSSIRTRVRTTLEQTGAPINPTDPFFDGMLGVSRISAVGAVAVGPIAPAAADINFDGVISAADITMLLNSWGPAPTFVRSDLNADGEVNAQDIAILLSNW